MDAAGQGLAGRDGRKYQWRVGWERRPNGFYGARSFALAERGVNRHEPVARNHPRQQNPHGLAILAARSVAMVISPQ